MDIKKLIEIAEDIGANDLKEAFEDLSVRMSEQNSPMILPLIGEFSSGKTTLINALTDNKKLETAITPTTSVIYQVFFGCEKCHAIILKSDGTTQDIEDIASIKNENMDEVLAVWVYDTATTVPETTVLVDTPGLSSNNLAHGEALVNFLPSADAVILVIDSNQGSITKSLLEFVDTMSLEKKKIFAVVTKNETKTKNEIDAIKKLISERCRLPIQNIASVCAPKGDLAEFYELLKNINNQKSQILYAVNEQRIKNLSKMLSDRIDELLKNTSNGNDLGINIEKQKNELEILKSNISHLIEDSKEKAESIRKKNIC